MSDTTTNIIISTAIGLTALTGVAFFMQDNQDLNTEDISQAYVSLIRSYNIPLDTTQTERDVSKIIRTHFKKQTGKEVMTKAEVQALNGYSRLTGKEKYILEEVLQDKVPKFEVSSITNIIN